VRAAARGTGSGRVAPKGIRGAGTRPPNPSPGAPPTDCNVQAIVEMEARAATVERLFMIAERQEWTFGQASEYALDAH